MRIDKILAHSGYGSRKEMKKVLKKERVEVNGERITDGKVSVDLVHDTIFVNGVAILYQRHHYFMLNKPKDVISATEDMRHRTVLDLFNPEDLRQDLFPVGRLDKDTTGLLLITNDGQLAHRLLSPKKHVDKKYWALIDGIVTEEDISAFRKGVILEDGYETLPAKLVILKAGNVSEIEITIKEGKFHQIKRMFHTRNQTVLELKRLEMGPLILDMDLAEGDYRELYTSEKNQLGIDEV